MSHVRITFLWPLLTCHMSTSRWFMTCQKWPKEGDFMTLTCLKWYAIWHRHVKMAFPWHLLEQFYNMFRLISWWKTTCCDFMKSFFKIILGAAGAMPGPCCPMAAKSIDVNRLTRRWWRQNVGNKGRLWHRHVILTWNWHVNWHQQGCCDVIMSIWHVTCRCQVTKNLCASGVAGSHCSLTSTCVCHRAFPWQLLWTVLQHVQVEPWLRDGDPQPEYFISSDFPTIRWDAQCPRKTCEGCDAYIHRLKSLVWQVFAKSVICWICSRWRFLQKLVILSSLTCGCTRRSLLPHCASQRIRGKSEEMNNSGWGSPSLRCNLNML